MAKFGNRIIPEAKTFLKRPSTYLMALLFLGILSSQFNINEDIELEKQEESILNDEALKIEETEALSAMEALEEVEEESKEAAEADEAFAVAKNLQANKAVKPDGIQSVNELSSAVAYKAVQVNVNDFAGELSWTSTFQKNIQSFVIERSMDDENYEKVGAIAGEGSGEFSRDISYSFQDTTLMFIQMPRVYYRIRQVGLDGKKGYGDVVEYDTGLEIGFYGSVTVGEENDLIIHYAADKSGPVRFEILNVFGESVHTGKLNAEYDPKSTQLDRGLFKKGTYYLKLSDDKNSFMQQFEVN